MAILLAIALGGTPIGALIVGWVADTFGPRWSLGVGAVSGFTAAIVGYYYLKKHCNLRVRIDAGYPRVSFDAIDLSPITQFNGDELGGAIPEGRGEGGGGHRDRSRVMIPAQQLAEKNGLVIPLESRNVNLDVPVEDDEPAGGEVPASPVLG